MLCFINYPGGRVHDTSGADIFRYPFDMRVLQREYQQVFSVQRAFDLEVVSIWKRR